ncbi:hypothetical protein G5B35_02420 [Parapusillimonas sp. SGNA-6]|nr:hypothetical protein [Parapusillimonas sp. SGNA-6]
MPNTKPGTDPQSPPKEPSADDRPQHEDEYLSKFLQTPTPENKSKDGKEAEPVNKSPDSKPAVGKPEHGTHSESAGEAGKAGEGKPRERP